MPCVRRTQEFTEAEAADRHVSYLRVSAKSVTCVRYKVGTRLYTYDRTRPYFPCEGIGIYYHYY